ncbi:hypothetical protein PIB30_007947 [Stylosanthes scabra]|uniref:Bet v I/Major latex protein domain-containing protein n=1 Tax=Stylosanthes scabra TaxID=79078 RepID=A0ABU6T5L6_9FABA|nr:hypothetical protein [Stylosanthes scabra]
MGTDELLKAVAITERIEGVDDAKRTIIYSVIDGDLLNNKYYKSYKGYISVTPKVDNNGGSILKWSCHYEKASQDVSEPVFIKEFITKIFQKLDDYLLSA